VTDERLERFRAARRDPALAVLEGFHALKHALRFGASIVDAIAERPEALQELAASLAPDVAEAMRRLVRPVAPGTLAELVTEPNPPPVLALAHRPMVDVAALLAPSPAPLVYLERPAQLGNLGAAVRVAAAAGAAGVLAGGFHDPWHPHAIRGSSGLHFALPVARLDVLPESARPLIAVHPEGEPMRAHALPRDALLAFGSERRGLSATLVERAARRVRIPMRPGVSSLNLATAVAVTLYLGCASCEDATLGGPSSEGT
jgi:TrmH family RNA methyltransferase